MLSKYNFELELEKLAERFYFNAGTQLVATRGGNSRGNEVYFGNLNSDLKQNLDCQLIILPKGECPDSGVFGMFNYQSRDDVDWQSVQDGKTVVIEVNAPNNLKRYIEVPVSDLNLPAKLDSDSDICIKLNDLHGYGEFFGIEFKASKNNNPKNISVASFNSTCPSSTKTSELNKIVLIHNLPTSSKKMFDKELGLKKHLIRLRIQFSMYYFIVNDEEVGTRSEIRHIFICNGSFFAPTTTEEEAARISKQLYPSDLNLDLNLYRVKLRYRPFFESRAIRANGYGLYTSWEPKIPGVEREERQRNLLLKEVEKIQQDFGEDKPDQVSQMRGSNDDNVIYLNLKAERIRSRAA
jgi:hypothetical protein